MKSLENKRWFIWSIVAIIVIGVGVYGYEMYVNTTDDGIDAQAGWITHHPKTAQSLNTTNGTAPATQGISSTRRQLTPASTTLPK